jgi:hypothetical protein
LQGCIKVISDVLIQEVGFAAFPFCLHAISAEGPEQTRGNRRIDLLEPFEESHANRVAFAD